MSAIREAIEAGDAAGLRVVLQGDPDAANADVRCGNGHVQPIHLVCDARFRHRFDDRVSVELLDVLLEAGADPRVTTAPHGDSLLIGAASLNAELVALRLLEVGADARTRGLFGATALHWAALQGHERLVPRLVEAGADVHLRDRQYRSTPIGWAVHAWCEGSQGDRDRLPGVVRMLRGFGGEVEPGHLERIGAPEHEAMRLALTC